MTPGHASSRALDMRRRVLRRKRAERTLAIVYHALAAIGAGFIVALTLRLLP